MLIVDFDDFCYGNAGLEELFWLKGINPAFKCTLFAVPALLDPDFVRALPDWLELAVHGATHETNYECEDWSATRLQTVLDLVEKELGHRFVHGFKAPGWQISDGCYEELARRGWWVADKEENNHRRPAMDYYLVGPNSWHGHIQNTCGNGLHETFPELAKRVAGETDFRFVSEALTPWSPSSPGPSTA